MENAARNSSFKVSYEIQNITRRAIILGLCIYDAIGVVVTLIAQLNGTLNFLGWGVFAIYLFFAVGFDYFWVKSPKP